MGDTENFKFPLVIITKANTMIIMIIAAMKTSKKTIIACLSMVILSKHMYFVSFFVTITDDYCDV